MRLFGRRDAEPEPTSQPASGPPRELDAVLDTLAVPCARLDPGPAPTSATSSYLAGHPYDPGDRPWPTADGRPMFFVGQLAFAELPPLPGFPEHGLLQWFVEADDVYGLTFDSTAGRVGFEVRWYADTSAPAVADPTTPTPWHVAVAAGEDLEAPLDITSPTGLLVRAGRMLPAPAELGDRVPVDVLARLAAALTDLPELAGHSNVGGSASFTQEDPRGTGGYPAVGDPAARLLVELDSAQFPGWGDAGIGHLFGDPAGLAAGDTSSVTYHWDCY